MSGTYRQTKKGLKIPSITNSTLDNIKKDAKKIKKSLGVTHKEALDIAAKNRGFVSFNHVRKNTQRKPMSNFLRIQLSDSVTDKLASPRDILTAPYNDDGECYINKNMVVDMNLEKDKIFFRYLCGEYPCNVELHFTKDGMGEYNRIKRELIG